MGKALNVFVLSTGLVFFSLAASGSPNRDASPLSLQREESAPKRALLLASHGDIDDADTELKPYIETSFQKNVGIPLPQWSRHVLTGPAYALSINLVREQYSKIGPTNYKKNAELQRAAIQQALDSQGANVKVYLGYNFTPPLIEDALEQMQKDGVEEFVVVNKGAQFSYASSGENMEDALSYLHAHPEWNVRALGLRHYAHDVRFMKALAKGINNDVERNFPQAAQGDTCVLVASHGLPLWLVNKGDPAVDQMLSAFETLKSTLPQFKLFHGFLNDDFFPGAKWVAPKAIDVVEPMQQAGCKNVLMDGRLSFTTHHRATLYDLNVEVREKLESGRSEVRAVLAPNFDADPEFATFMASLAQEALLGKGNLITLKQKNAKPIPRGDAGTPGRFSFEF
jgi:ferrochelatase